MQNLVVILISFFWDPKYHFWGKTKTKNKFVSLNWSLILWLIWMSRVQWWCFFLFRPEVSFFWKCFPKNQNCLLKLKFRTYTNLNMENWIVILFVCFFFFFLDWRQLFWVNLFQKFKTASWSWNVVPFCTEYAKFDSDVHFFCFRLCPFSILTLTD